LELKEGKLMKNFEQCSRDVYVGSEKKCEGFCINQKAMALFSLLCCKNELKTGGKEEFQGFFFEFLFLIIIIYLFSWVGR
jgi:hypothetical protein